MPTQPRGRIDRPAAQCAVRAAETRGMWLGAAGVLVFSLTLPFTRLAVAELNPLLVACGRAVVAAFAAALLLWQARAPRPTFVQARALLVTASGVVVGFPVLMSEAMHYVPASHGAVMLGILPLLTALVGALRFGERPSAGFWLVALAGSALVIGFALWQGGGELHGADLALFAAVLAGAVGYAEGGALAPAMGGTRVICWALVLSLPLLVPASAWLAWRYGIEASPRAWIGFAYVSMFSMFIGFFFWYKGMALGGIARVGQVQLIQPFLTLVGAALIAGEKPAASSFVFALAVLAVVALGRRMAVRRQR